MTDEEQQRLSQQLNDPSRESLMEYRISKVFRTA
jgi:hypothetical protein